MLLGSLDVCLLGSMLAGKKVIQTGEGQGTIKAGQDF